MLAREDLFETFKAMPDALAHIREFAVQSLEGAERSRRADDA